MCILDNYGEKITLRRFKFTLESVLTVRKHTLEDERIKLASVMGILREQNEVLNNMNFEYQTLQMRSEKDLALNFNPLIMSNYSSFSGKLLGDIKVQKQIIERTRLDLKNRQQSVKQAYVEVETLEKLKQKQKELYLKELQQEEIKELDDIVNSKRKLAFS